MWYYIGMGRKINAIKHYRSATGADLRTSKGYVEKLMDDMDKLDLIG